MDMIGSGLSILVVMGVAFQVFIKITGKSVSTTTKQVSSYLTLAIAATVVVVMGIVQNFILKDMKGTTLVMIMSLVLAAVGIGVSTWSLLSMGNGGGGGGNGGDTGSGSGGPGSDNGGTGGDAPAPGNDPNNYYLTSVSQDLPHDITIPAKEKHQNPSIVYQKLYFSYPTIAPPPPPGAYDINIGLSVELGPEAPPHKSKNYRYSLVDNNGKTIVPPTPIEKESLVGRGMIYKTWKNNCIDDPTNIYLYIYAKKSSVNYVLTIKAARIVLIPSKKKCSD